MHPTACLAAWLYDHMLVCVSRCKCLALQVAIQLPLRITQILNFFGVLVAVSPAGGNQHASALNPNPHICAMLTDFYQITMGYAYFKAGKM